MVKVRAEQFMEDMTLSLRFDKIPVFSLFDLADKPYVLHGLVPGSLHVMFTLEIRRVGGPSAEPIDGVVIDVDYEEVGADRKLSAQRLITNGSDQ